MASVFPLLNYTIRAAKGMVEHGADNGLQRLEAFISSPHALGRGPPSDIYAEVVPPKASF